VSRLHEINGAEHGQTGEDRNEDGKKGSEIRPPEGKPEEQEGPGDGYRVDDEARREWH